MTHTQPFTCTFCWHPSYGPPHTLGRSARLTCESCYRGLESVSLGWCFWHRACYGCLFCGSRLVVIGPTIAELFVDDDDDDDDGDDDRVANSRGGDVVGTGREITEVPICANCAVECEVDCEDRRAFVRNALCRVDKSDGGMAGMRWVKMGGQMSRRAVGEIKRVPATVPKSDQSPPSLHRSRWSIQGRTHTSHAFRLPVDGALGAPEELSGSEGNRVALPDPVIYVSIFDPINEPSFKPSPTKPIPKWMRWLPSQRGQDRRQQTEPRPHSILDQYFPPNPTEPDDYPISNSPTICPTSPSPSPLYLAATPRPPNRLPTPRSSEFGKLAESTITALKGPSFVLDEPLKRPSSRMAQPTSASPKSANAVFTPLPNPPDPRSHTPYVPQQPSPLVLHNSKAGPREAVPRRAPSPLTEQVTAHLQRRARRTPPAQSREFLNIYNKPFQPRSPSAAVPGRRQDRGVGDGMQIRDMLGRDRTPSPSSGGPKHVVTDGGEVVDVRSMRKKSGLQSEIKRFLSGRGGGGGREG
ncbi:hypothetical protein F4813DRAFT_383483 [Daldinia decipiens]|uniref:uncharacterized protein n=1 Tax=Daldinia decipiens TaxID=326647 RepID=UPI0020C43E64|nr:uncharacterized protein F4813DRAFT_383483 [Daldinia decipiens]KAI1653182.1 hypothetical protein F4813DRAFT_383483 [Daldinia decipiens]